jgi:class 3 adenylate cyclase/predicted ATPase
MIYVFDDYELDTEYYELRHRGEPLQIEPKVFDLLAYFVQHPGQFISKDDLHAHLWPQQYVSEASLIYCVTGARKAVGDSGRAQRLIKTVPRRGYRFVGTVEARGSQRTEPARPAVLEPLAAASQPVADAPDALAAAPPVASTLASPTARDTPPVETERRQLTMLWCRLTTASTLSDTVDPEELHDIRQDTHTRCVEIIQRFEGHLAQYLGDAFLVYFGYPQAHEDDARRAVSTGLELVRDMERLNQGLGSEGDPKLTVRVGIHTGLVVLDHVGSGAKREQLALGDTPHVTMQIASFAEPNTVVISPTTAKLVQGYFLWQELGSHVLDNLQQPLAMYHVLQASGAESRLAAAVTIGLTRFVGRREEMGLLHARWEQVKRGRGQVVLLSGEAGIGKSRLVQVLYERLAADNYTRIECRCSPYYQNSALHPVAEYLQRWLQWERDDSAQVKLSKLEGALQPYDVAAEEVIPLLASMLSLPLPEGHTPRHLPPQVQKHKTLEALLTLLLQQAEQQPICLVMEDLHWADPSTLELLGLCIEQVHTARMLLLLNFRPDFRPPWRLRSHITHITLSRLMHHQIERMIKRVTQGKTLPAAVVQQLVAKSDGVPLFVEEMTRMVLESGLVKECDGHYELVGPLTPLAFPHTLHDLLMARLDRLGTDKHIVQLGATLGREFSYEVIRAVSQMEESVLQQTLAHLVDVELLSQQGFPPQARYTFRHVLIQEAAYQSLLRSTRRRHHAWIAEVLEARFPEIRQNHPELLAYHYMGAGLHSQAITHWQHAGQYAMTHSAHVEAIAHFRQALELNAALPETPERLRTELALQTSLGVALMSTQGYASSEVEQAYLRAQHVCEQVGETSQLFTVMRGVWLMRLVRGELRTAHALGEQLLRVAEGTQDATMFMEAHRALGTSLFTLGAPTQALHHLRHGRQLYDFERHRSLTIHYGQDSGVVSLGYAAWSLWLMGYPTQAIDSMQEALRLAQRLEHPYSWGFVLTFAAMLHQWRREPQAMLHQIDTCLTLAREYAFPLLVALGVTLQGWGLVEQGRIFAGIRQIRRGLAAYRATGAELAQTYMLALLAEAYRRQNKIDAGLNALAEALALVDETGERYWEAELYRLRGELLLAQASQRSLQTDVSHPWHEPEHSFRQALEVASRQQAKSLELRAAMSLARLGQQHGRRDVTRHLLAARYGWFTEGLDTLDLQEAKALLDA